MIAAAPQGLRVLPRLPRRLADWPERLAAYLDARRHVPFSWGTNDCATFALGGIRALTGARLADLLPGVWANEPEAAAMLRQLGGLETAAIGVLGEPVRGRLAATAPRGWVVLAHLLERPTLGLAAGNGWWCGPGPAGLVFRPQVEVAVAWEV